jgi:peptidyl-prolyl cis-trans isomerase A (cyclophilin A)
VTYRIQIKKILWIYILAFILTAFSFNSKAADTEAKTDTKVETKTEKSEKKTDAKKDKAGSKKDKTIIAVFETNQGNFKAKLNPEVAPVTVENFVGLATGTKEWTDPKTGKKVKKPFYDGLTFHRVIPDFMIQGGDPKNNGTGDPGYKFDDETAAKSIVMDKAGYLAMANAGPNTNGSQFFITVSGKARLNDGNPAYNVFGEIIEGQDVVNKISLVKTAAQDHPVKEVVIKHVKIENK